VKVNLLGGGHCEKCGIWHDTAAGVRAHRDAYPGAHKRITADEAKRIVADIKTRSANVLDTGGKNSAR
jgi:hypothetical protein